MKRHLLSHHLPQCFWLPPSLRPGGKLDRGNGWPFQGPSAQACSQKLPRWPPTRKRHRSSGNSDSTRASSAMVSSVLLAHSSWASTDPGWISKREFLQRHASAHCLLNAAPISCHHSVKESMKSLSSPWRNLHWGPIHHTPELAPHAALSGL